MIEARGHHQQFVSRGSVALPREPLADALAYRGDQLKKRRIVNGDRPRRGGLCIIWWCAIFTDISRCGDLDPRQRLSQLAMKAVGLMMTQQGLRFAEPIAQLAGTVCRQGLPVFSGEFVDGTFQFKQTRFT